MKKIIFYISFLVILVIAWQYFGHSNNKVRLLISSPSMIYKYFTENYSNILTAVFTTFLESFIGLLVATLFSFLIMILCLRFPKFLEIILPIFIGSQVVPIIALAPLLIMLFGLGIEAKVVMAALMCFFPLFINFLSGINSISSTTKELLYIYHASNWFRIFKISFPLSLPNIFTGLKISATLSVIGSIVAEFNGANFGLGKNLFLAAKRLEPELLMTSLLFSIILGGFMYFIIWMLEKKLGKWYLN